MKRKQKERKVKLILALIILLTLISIGLIYNYIRPLDIEKIPVSFHYAEKSGFENIPGELSFGALTTNQGASRSIYLSNDYEFPVKIQIRYSGEIIGCLIASENNFILKENQTKEITFSAFAWDDLPEYRKYSGEVEVITKRASFF